MGGTAVIYYYLWFIIWYAGNWATKGTVAARSLGKGAHSTMLEEAHE